MSSATPSGPATILLVDDEPVSRLSMAARLKRMGLRVLEAANGKEGLVILRRERPDLTILDWVMPEMDGPTVCEAVRQDTEIHSSQIILMTSHDQPDQIAEGLARGADDFLSKSASKQEIIARVQSGLRTASLVRSIETTRDELRLKQQELEAELQSAAGYIRSLLPQFDKAHADIRMSWQYRPSLALGGDIFNFAQWNNDNTYFYILDASGHGVSPALRAASLYTFLQPNNLQHYMTSNDPAAILREANRQYPLTEEGSYFTLWVGSFNRSTRTLHYATAGHGGIWAYVALVGVAALATILVVRWIVSGRHGRAITAMRDDEEAFKGLGHDAVRLKLVLFAVGSGFAGLAGGLYAHYFLFVTPEQFEVLYSAAMLTMVVVGGIRSVWGPALGAVLLQLLPSAINFLKLPSSVTGPLQGIIFTGLVLVFMFARPQGLLGAAPRAQVIADEDDPVEAAPR